MKAWLSEYWYLLIVLALVIVIAAVIVFFASKAYKKYRSTYSSQEKEIKRLVALKEKYVPLSEKAIIESDGSDLLEGVALSYQLSLQKEENMEKAFSLLSDEERYIYILDVFVSDKSAGEFFKQNGDILRMEIVKALSLIGMKDFADKLEKIRKMFDITDEVTSLDEKEIEIIDKLIEEKDILSEIKLKGAEFIKNNYVAFVNK